ncbi:hypothetical protein GN244_ATG06563 [Phytophthora infestans]|uniref:Uncharacterized protein n=1 Tax=Phytophthora infestans TaxID=4787 RepID=A0A833TI16_PHYIN|nr:hypothetical protein GN244_ATG06557 [Phytophthora infestans]KAF4041216.1 hypothetical protein GN244_ATG06563 [Phytophthora infestans]
MAPSHSKRARSESSSSSVSNFEPKSSSNDESSSVGPPPANIRTKTKRVPVSKEETAALVFQTWQALLSAFDDYCEATHQPFRKRSSISAPSRNKKSRRRNPTNAKLSWL